MGFQLCNFCDLNLNDILIVCFGVMLRFAERAISLLSKMEAKRKRKNT